MKSVKSAIECSSWSFKARALVSSSIGQAEYHIDPGSGAFIWHILFYHEIRKYRLGLFGRLEKQIEDLMYEIL